MPSALVSVRIPRPHLLPAEVTGERNVWLVYLRSYGSMGSHLTLRAVSRGSRCDVEFLDGKGQDTRSLMELGFFVRRDSTKHKILAALVPKGIAQIR